MNTATYDLPSIDDWTQKALVTFGIPKGALYRYMFLIDSSGKPVGHHVMEGSTATVIERLKCIKHKSGSTDARLHQSVRDAKCNIRLVVIG